MVLKDSSHTAETSQGKWLLRLLSQVVQSIVGACSHYFDYAGWKKWSFPKSRTLTQADINMQGKKMFLNIYKGTKHEYNIKFKTTNLSPFEMLKREYNTVFKSGEKKSFYSLKHI